MKLLLRGHLQNRKIKQIKHTRLPNRFQRRVFTGCQIVGGLLSTSKIDPFDQRERKKRKEGEERGEQSKQQRWSRSCASVRMMPKEGRCHWLVKQQDNGTTRPPRKNMLAAFALNHRKDNIDMTHGGRIIHAADNHIRQLDYWKKSKGVRWSTGTRGSHRPAHTRYTKTQLCDETSLHCICATNRRRRFSHPRARSINLASATVTATSFS